LYTKTLLHFNVLKFRKNNEPPSQMHYIITFLFDLTMFRTTPTQTFSTSSYYNLLLILHQHFIHFMHTLLHDLSSTWSLACSPHFSPLGLTILTNFFQLSIRNNFLNSSWKYQNNVIRHFTWWFKWFTTTLKPL
jgi:hypothetical protein